MSNEFAINIAVNPGGAPTAIANVHKPLAELEAMGPRVSKSLSEGFRGSMSSAEKFASSASSATEQFKRQADMLEKIRGPAREYVADMDALGALLRKNTISTEEYRSQVEKLNEELERSNRRPGKSEAPESSGMRVEGLGGALAGRGGELGGMAQSLASGAAIEGAAVVALGAEVIKLGDEYTTLQNNALRLVSSFDQVDDAISSQNALSKQLHGSLEQTMELSILMRERTEQLGLTTLQQTELTRTWAEAVQVSGHSMADAGPAFDRLTMALEAGQGGARALREIFFQYPAIAEALEKHFGVDTPAALLTLARDGKMHAEDLRAAMTSSAEDIEEKFKHLHETLGQQFQHFKDDMTTSIGKLVEESGVVQSLGDAFKGLGTVVQASLEPIRQLDDLLGGDGNIKSFLTSGALGNLERVVKLIRGDDGNAGGASAVEMFNDMAEHAQQGVKLWETQYDGISKFDRAVQGAAATLDSFLAKHFGDTWKDAAKAVEHHVAALTEEQRLLAELNKPLDDIAKRELSLQVLRDTSAISANRYALETEKLREQLEKLNQTEAKLAVTGAIHGLGLGGLGDDIKSVARDFVPYLSAIDTAAEAIKKASDQQKEWTKAYDEWEKVSESALSGVDRGLKSIQHDTLNIGREMERAFKDAFNNINSALTDLITTGTADWHKLFDTLERDAVRLSLQFAEGQLMRGIGGDSASSVAAATTTSTAITTAMTVGGTTAASTIGGAMIAAGVSAAASIAAAMAAGGASGGAAAAVDAISGAANGMERTIVHAASGYSGTFGGHGGTDSQLFMARVTPGEHVSIQTPQQRAAQQQAQAPASPVTIHNHIDGNELLTLIQSPAMGRAIDNHIRLNAPGIRRILGR